MGQLAGLRAIAKKGDTMKILTTAFGLSAFLATMGGSSMMPAVASAHSVERTYVACNQYGDCWRVHRRYAYGSDAPVTYYKSDWYDAHQGDEHVHWLSDPANDRGYYDRDASWHDDSGARPARRLAPPWVAARAPSPAQRQRRTTDRSLAPVGSAAPAAIRGAARKRPKGGPERFGPPFARSRLVA